MDFGGVPLTSTGSAFDGYVVRVVEQPNGIPQTTWARQLDATGSVRYLSVDLMPDQATIVVQGKFAGTIDVDPSAGVQLRTAQGLDDLFLVGTRDGGWHVCRGLAGGRREGRCDGLHAPLTHRDVCLSRNRQCIRVGISTAQIRRSPRSDARRHDCDTGPRVRADPHESRRTPRSR